MNLFLATAIIIASVAAAVGAMLFLRRRAPEGGHFRDSDRASGVFGFVGAGFAIVLGFVVLLTFEGYSNAKAKAKAEDEATAVWEQYDTSALFQPKERRDRIQGELVCYARSVIGHEWPAMKSGERSAVTDGWIERLESEIPAAHIATISDSTAYQQWFEDTKARDDARRGRLLEAANVLPSLMWIMLIAGAGVVIGFTLLYADPLERALGQGMFAGGVTSLIVTSLLAVSLLASPFQNENGSIKPTGMQYTLQLMQDEAVRLGEPVIAPCDPAGAAITRP